MADKEQAEQTARLFNTGSTDTTITEARLEVAGDLGKILENCLADADAMYHNDGEKVSEKYGYNV